MKVRASHVYITMMFIMSLANATMFTTYAVYFIATLGLNPLQLLIVGTVLEVTAFVFEGITGVVADMYSRRWSVIIGMLILGIGFLLGGNVQWIAESSHLVPIFAWLLLSEFVKGVGYTFLSGANTAWIVDEEGKERVGALFMRSKRFSLLGTLLGIASSVGLYACASNLPFIIGGLMYVSLGIFLLFFMKETKFVRPMRTEQLSQWQEMKTTWLSGVTVIRRHPVLLAILFVTIFSGAASEGYDRLWEAHLIADIGFPGSISLSMAVWFGIIAVLSTFLSLIAVQLAEKRVDMSDERVVLAGMFVLTGLRIAGLIAFALSPSFLWALCALLAIGVIKSLEEPMYETWLNLNIDSKVRATVLSMINQSDALGQSGGGPLVGWVGNRLSIRASLLVAAALLTPILLVFGRVLKKNR